MTAVKQNYGEKVLIQVCLFYQTHLATGSEYLPLRQRVL